MAIKFEKPTVEAVRAYCAEKGYNVDAERFVNYYESNGWKVGRNPMKSWEAAVATWAKNDYSKRKEQDSTSINPSSNGPFKPLETSDEDLIIERNVTLRDNLGLSLLGLYSIDDTLCDAVAREKVLLFIQLLMTDDPAFCEETSSLDCFIELFCKAFGNASFSPINAIRNYIKKTPYSDFLKTPYWKTLSYKAKKKAGFKCVVCDSTENLQAHHKRYDNHGDIIKEVDDLVCLCAECHAKIHGKYQKD